jgi:Tfp pilus assembly protein PilZ
MRGRNARVWAVALALVAACEKTTIESDPDSRADVRVADAPSPRDLRGDGLDRSSADRRRDAGPTPDTRAPDLAPPKHWAVRAGGPNYDIGANVLVASDGAIFVEGFFHDTASFGPTTLTAGPEGGLFVAKLDRAGAYLWAIALPGTPDDQHPEFGYFSGMGLDAAGNLLVAAPLEKPAKVGGTMLTPKGETDVFVTKLDPAGKVLWVTPLGGAGREQVNRLVVDGAGQTTLTGTFAGTASFGSYTRTAAGTSDLFVARLDPAGKVLWVAQAGSDSVVSDAEHGIGIALDSAGNTYVTAQIYGDAAFGSAKVTAPSKARSGAVAKLDPAGTWLWARVAPEPVTFSPMDLTVDGGGNVYLAGWSLTAMPFLNVGVAKLDPAGNWLWSTSALSPAAGWAQQIGLRGTTLLVSGTFGGKATFGQTVLTASGLRDAFLAKVDPGSGQWLTAESFGGSGVDAAVTFAWDSAGDLVVSGAFSSTTSFGATPLTSAGERDLFVWKRPAP